MPTSQQFICQRCRSLADVTTFEEARDGTPFCRCPNCGARNAVVNTGLTPSQPGILPVTKLLD